MLSGQFLFGHVQKVSKAEWLAEPLSCFNWNRCDWACNQNSLGVSTLFQLSFCIRKHIFFASWKSFSLISRLSFPPCFSFNLLIWKPENMLEFDVFGEPLLNSHKRFLLWFSFFGISNSNTSNLSTLQHSILYDFTCMIAALCRLINRYVILCDCSDVRRHDMGRDRREIRNSLLIESRLEWWKWWKTWRNCYGANIKFCEFMNEISDFIFILLC